MLFPDSWNIKRLTCCSIRYSSKVECLWRDDSSMRLKDCVYNDPEGRKNCPARFYDSIGSESFDIYWFVRSANLTLEDNQFTIPRADAQQVLDESAQPGPPLPVDPISKYT